MKVAEIIECKKCGKSVFVKYKTENSFRSIVASPIGQAKQEEDGISKCAFCGKEHGININDLKV